MDPLASWLRDQCEQRNVSGTAAAVRAGVNRSAVSAIMHGQRPGLEVCKALARYFGVPPQYVLTLAGHLPPDPTPEEIDPESRFTIQRLLEILARMPKSRQRSWMRSILSLTELLIDAENGKGEGAETVDEICSVVRKLPAHEQDQILKFAQFRLEYALSGGEESGEGAGGGPPD